MTASNRHQINVLADRAELARTAADHFVEAAERAVADRGAFTVALSGGSTPRDLFQLLAGDPWRDRVDWTRTVIFWGDERCVSPEDERSNFRLASELLLSRVPVAPNNVYRMRGELADRYRAAEEYAEHIMQRVAVGPAGLPRFDLMLQGLGGDGHTASLLPGSELIDEYERLVAVTDLEREGTIRLTVTPPVLQHASRLLFLVAGADKSEALREVIAGPDQRERYPAQVIREAQGEIVWLLDRPAAALLPEDLV